MSDQAPGKKRKQKVKLELTRRDFLALAATAAGSAVAAQALTTGPLSPFSSLKQSQIAGQEIGRPCARRSPARHLQPSGLHAPDPSGAPGNRDLGLRIVACARIAAPRIPKGGPHPDLPVHGRMMNPKDIIVASRLPSERQ